MKACGDGSGAGGGEPGALGFGNEAPGATLDVDNLHGGVRVAVAVALVVETVEGVEDLLQFGLTGEILGDGDFEFEVLPDVAHFEELLDELVVFVEILFREGLAADLGLGGQALPDGGQVLRFGTEESCGGGDGLNVADD